MCHLSHVRDSNRVAPDRGGGEDLVVLLDVDDGRTTRTDARTADSAGGGAREGDSAEVGEGHESAVRAEVLYDPLRVVLAQRGLARECVRDRLAVGVVGDLDGAARRRGGGDADGDLVPRGEADAGEVVRVVGEPLVPRWSRTRSDQWGGSG